MKLMGDATLVNNGIFNKIITKQSAKMVYLKLVTLMVIGDAKCYQLAFTALQATVDTVSRQLASQIDNCYFSFQLFRLRLHCHILTQHNN